jgi:tetratricopeptide (TPR) repeat protein
VVHVLSDHPRARRAAVGVLCARRPLQLEPATLDAHIAAHGLLADDLSAVGLDGFAVTSLLTMDRGLLELFAPRAEARHDARPALDVRGALRTTGMARRLEVGLQVFATQRRNPMPWVRPPPPERPIFDAIARDRFRSWAHLYGGALDAVRVLGPAGPAFDLEAPGHCPEAEAEHLLPALAGLPDWVWLRELVVGFARRLEADGRPAEAEHYLRRAVDECDPGSAPLRFALAGVVERRGDRADAITLYRTALAFDPVHKGARLALQRLGADADSGPDDG